MLYLYPAYVYLKIGSRAEIGVPKLHAGKHDKLKIENNAKKVRFQNFESWNNGRQEFKELEKTQFLDGFISELKNTIPFKQEILSYLFKGEDTSQKFIYITLNDGSEVQLRFFKGGYVYYGNSHIFFKMENEFFNPNQKIDRNDS